MTGKQIKALAPLRSSDRRRIADQIIADYGVEVPLKEATDQPETGQEIATTGVGAIRNALLPDNTQSARFTTTAGKDLKQVSGTLYVGKHPGQPQRVLWIKLEDRLLPTVYTLWMNRGLVPLLHTPDVVLQKLRGGADLMTPGLARGPPFPPKATKGSVVAIASLEKPNVPMVVGICEIDVASLQQVRGAKGHAVRGEHWDGDEIWAWSQGGSGGGSAPDDIQGWDTYGGGSGLEERLNDIGIEDSDDAQNDGGVPIPYTTSQKNQEKGQNEFVEGEDAEPFERVDEEEKDLSTKGMLQLQSPRPNLTTSSDMEL